MRNLDTGTKVAFASGVLRPVAFVEAEFESGWLRVWSGIGQFSWDAKTWIGVGDLGDISEINETAELRAAGIGLSLSGIPSALLGTVIGDLRQGKPCRVFFGALDEAGALAGEPYGAFIGRLDTATVEDGPEVGRITLAVENRLIDIEKPRLRRYTHEDQKIDYPNDLGLEHVANLWKTIRLPTAIDTRPPGL